MHSRNKLKRYIFLIFTISLIIYASIQFHLYKTSIVEGWDYSTSRNTVEYIFPNATTFLIKPTDFCKSDNLLMVIVCSAPRNFIERKAVRDSWGLKRNIMNATYSVYFLLGLPVNHSLQKQIKLESDTYNDIIQEHFIDTYNNLTLKSIMMLKLVTNNCRNSVSYVMKTDDDMFVNLVPLVKNLLSRTSSSKVLFGNLMAKGRPIREYYERWYAPKYMYADEKYPNYLSGTGYVMSADVCEILFEKALETPIFHLEDVYLTGICATAANITATHNSNFNYKFVPFNPCRYLTLITAHYFNAKEKILMHLQVHNSDLPKMCRYQKKYSFYETLEENKKLKVI